MYIITIPDILPVCVIKHNVHVDYNAQTSVSILHAVEACSACVCLYIHTTLWCFHNTCIIVHYGAFVIYVWSVMQSQCTFSTLFLMELLPMVLFTVHGCTALRDSIPGCVEEH